MQSGNAEQVPYFEGKVNDTAQPDLRFINEIHFLSYIKSIVIKTLSESALSFMKEVILNNFEHHVLWASEKKK